MPYRCGRPGEDPFPGGASHASERVRLPVLDLVVGAGEQAKKLTWTEHQEMNAEHKHDPYNLDDEAKKKLAESQRKRKW
jgi:hypothetical protein